MQDEVPAEAEATPADPQLSSSTTLAPQVASSENGMAKTPMLKAGADGLGSHIGAGDNQGVTQLALQELWPWGHVCNRHEP